MSDIIKDAKQLLAGTTPAPWEHYDEHGIVSLTSGDTAIATDLNPWDADLITAAPELAQALAEETYEYAVQVKCTESKEWRLLSFKLPFITHKTTWFRSQSEAEHQRQEQVSEQVNYRIVRRRVSPPEVISE